jgi:hypothetical protein
MSLIDYVKEKEVILVSYKNNKESAYNTILKLASLRDKYQELKLTDSVITEENIDFIVGKNQLEENEDSSYEDDSYDESYDEDVD